MKKTPAILFLDFDGTLSPIAGHPSSARLPSQTKKYLKSLLKRDVGVSVVTGRSLKDIMEKVGLKDVIYAANHGLEIYRNGGYLLRLGSKYKKPVEKLGGEFSKAFKDIRGAVVENKGLSVAVHTRMVSGGKRKLVEMLVKKISKPWLKKYGLQLTTGKMIWEVRPASYWNKGNAVLWILKHHAKNRFPIYVGDDTTDEAAFKALLRLGMTLRVGYKKDSYAQFYLRSSSRLLPFLKSIFS